MSDPVIVTQGLVKRFGRVRALDGLDLEVAAGDVHGFGLMLVGEFAPLFGEAWEWVQRMSPFFWVANPLDAEPDWTGSWWLLGIAAALLAAAFARFARRDVTI